MNVQYEHEQSANAVYGQFNVSILLNGWICLHGVSKPALSRSVFERTIRSRAASVVFGVHQRQLSAHVTRITVTGGYGEHLARFFAVNSPLIVTYSYSIN